MILETKERNHFWLMFWRILLPAHGIMRVCFDKQKTKKGRRYA